LIEPAGRAGRLGTKQNQGDARSGLADQLDEDAVEARPTGLNRQGLYLSQGGSRDLAAHPRAVIVALGVTAVQAVTGRKGYPTTKAEPGTETPERLGHGRADVPPRLRPPSRAEWAENAATRRGPRACPSSRGALRDRRWDERLTGDQAAKDPAAGAISRAGPDLGPYRGGSDPRSQCPAGRV